MDDKLISLSFWQSENVDIKITVIFDGNSIFSREEHSLKAAEPMNFTDEGIVTFYNK